MKLSETQLAALRQIGRNGMPSRRFTQSTWNSLTRHGLITFLGTLSGYAVTDAGRAALNASGGVHR